MSFQNGDQLMLTVIHYGSTSRNELKYVHIYIGSLSYVAFSVHSGTNPGSQNIKTDACINVLPMHSCLLPLGFTSAASNTSCPSQKPKLYITVTEG